jgi:hypothetical protein
MVEVTNCLLFQSLGSSGKHVGLAADVSSLSSVKAALKEVSARFLTEWFIVT